MKLLLPLVLLALLALAPAASAAPNVVVIETDDQTAADMSVMPRTRELIGDAGVTFDDSIVTLSQCCPSRATLLTGRYTHNHGVLSASIFNFGGVEFFDPSETLAVWLQRAGYATTLVGKYMNGYGLLDQTGVPPGWTEWHGLLGYSTYRFYGYTFNHDGQLQKYGFGAEDYQTDEITRLSEEVVRRRAADERPFFLWTTYVAPHASAQRLDLFRTPPGALAHPAPRHRNAFFGAALPTNEAFNEADVSDKPAAIRRRMPLKRGQLRRLRIRWQRRAESLLAVDEGVARIVQALRDAGELDDTLLVFTSDNGFILGEHRIVKGKIVPYEASVAVPLLIRGPGVPHGARRSQLVWNGDLAPTILEAAGARAPWDPDGASLWPLLRDPAAGLDRAVLLEGPPEPDRARPIPRFTGVRTDRYLYVEYLNGERELYDVRRDPRQLENLVRKPRYRPVKQRLARHLEALRDCSGSGCRRPLPVPEARPRGRTG
jgi:N-acetylglucosamine-6-sulfatase